LLGELRRRTTWYSVDRDLQPQFVIAQPVFVCCTVHKNGHQGLVARDWSYAAGKLQ
jgi:hypothetical protein